MKRTCNRISFGALSLALCLWAGKASAEPDIRQHLRTSLVWQAPKLKAEIPLEIYHKGSSAAGGKSPVIVYVLNHHAPRVGQEADTAILRDYLNEGFVIVTADFKKNPQACSPYFDEDLLALHRALDGSKGAACVLRGAGLVIDPYEHYFLPAGYRLARNLVYFELDKHSSPGTSNFVMSVWNTVLHKKENVPMITDPKDMKSPDGSALDWQLRMDVIYPSRADASVPLLVYASTQSIRMRCFRTELDAPHVAGFSMRGYACAIVDHCWNPLARHTAYGYFDGPYSLNVYNGLKSSTAAIRYLNSRASEFGHDPNRIGVMGYSKGAYMVTRLSDPDHEKQGEEKVFNPATPDPPQPWPGFSSRIRCGYQAMGLGTRDYKKFITNPNYAPQVITAGEFDQFGYWAHWPGLRAHFEQNHLPHLALPMPGKGHILIWGYDEKLKVDRYAATMEYFDRFLKPEKEVAP